MNRSVQRASRCTWQKSSDISRDTLVDYVLPLQVHFRHCWLFSWMPDVDRSTVYRSHFRTMDGTAAVFSKKSFWLTAEGHLMCTESYTEHCKLHSLWVKNTGTIESSSDDDGDQSKVVLTTSAAAHRNLIRICNETQAVSRGRFFHMYPREPVRSKVDFPLQQDEANNVKKSMLQLRVTPALIDCNQWRVLATGTDLIRELEPLYSAYFAFLDNPQRFPALNRRVEELEARSLMQTDCDEIQLGSKIRQGWFTRLLIRLTLLIFS